MSSGFYGTIQKSNKGNFALRFPIDYDFFGSGIIIPGIINVYLWGMQDVPFYYVKSMEELARVFETSQQNVSRYLKRGSDIALNVTSGKYSEVDIWGWSPTQKRREELGLAAASPSKEANLDKETK